MKHIILIGCYLISLQLFAGSGKKPDRMKITPYKGSAELEKLKTLAGTWKGKISMGQGKNKKAMDYVVTYKVAGSGSTVVETSFPNTPREMITVYHDNNKKLSMVHYCSLRNQPKMKEAGSKGNVINLKFAGGTNLNPKKDMHMRSLKLTIKDKNTIVQEWTMFREGKKAGVNAITLTRAK